MTKAGTLMLGIVLGMLAFISQYVVQNSLFALLFCIGAVLAFWRWYAKKERDDALIAQAAKEREASPPEDSVTVPVMQPSSRRLFVPKPLDSNR